MKHGVDGVERSKDGYLKTMPRPLRKHLAALVKGTPMDGREFYWGGVKGGEHTPWHDPGSR